MDISFVALDGARRPSSSSTSCPCVTVSAPEGAASLDSFQICSWCVIQHGLEGVPEVVSSSLLAYTSVQGRPRYLIHSHEPMLKPHLAGNDPRLLHPHLCSSKWLSKQWLAVMHAKARGHSTRIHISAWSTYRSRVWAWPVAGPHCRRPVTELQGKFLRSNSCLIWQQLLIPYSLFYCMILR